MTTFSILTGKFSRTSSGWLVETEGLEATGHILERAEGHAVMMDDRPVEVYGTHDDAVRALRRACT